MKVLLIYPEFPLTFWSFKYALKFIGKKASDPPLGLLTVAALLPPSWEKKLVDMNTQKLSVKDILWSDFVFISAMDVQKISFNKVVKMCNDLNVKIVAGGPMVTQNHESFPNVDYFILNEAEITLEAFLKDFEEGHLERVYETKEFSDLSRTPIPNWSLLNMKDYASMDLQYSRGCPFNCEFCSITTLFGNKTRVKETSKFLDEINSLYSSRWRGPVFIVDDNFIGNKKNLKNEMLPALIKWQKEHNYPFNFTTEVSINLSDDEVLMDLMREAGFDSCFVGIESPIEESLNECRKIQNQGRDLVKSVKIMQRKGFSVMGGFIIGFDNDPIDIFEKQEEFIRKSGIVTAMVGLLSAPKGTILYKKLKSENRIISEISGNNTDGRLNFITQINQGKLKNGYKELMKKLYHPKIYYERIKMFLLEYSPPPKNTMNRSLLYIVKALFKTVIKLGIFRKEGKRYFWRLFGYTLVNHPGQLGLALTFAVYGYHFQMVAESI